MSEKERKTQIIAHCGIERLRKTFPDYEHDTFYDIVGDDGELVDSVNAGYTAAGLVKKYAKLAGYTIIKREETKLEQNYIRILDRHRWISYKGERKTAIEFKSYNTDEADHYAEVDEIVKELALKDIAVLRGECEITITTRC